MQATKKKTQVLGDTQKALSRAQRERASREPYKRSNHRIVGMTNSAPARMPVGQREVMVLSLV